MSQFIGESLNDKQVAALQLVADVSCGARYCRITRLPEEATNMTYRALHDEYGDVSAESLDALLAELKSEGLVEFADSKGGGALVGLTHDGKRCNRINVMEF